MSFKSTVNTAKWTGIAGSNAWHSCRTTPCQPSRMGQGRAGTGVGGSKRKRNSQNSSLWVERLHGVDLVEDCARIHQDLPNVVVIAPVGRKKNSRKVFFFLSFSFLFSKAPQQQQESRGTLNTTNYAGTYGLCSQRCPTASLSGESQRALSFQIWRTVCGPTYSEPVEY